jgi:hypothetical protein
MCGPEPREEEITMQHPDLIVLIQRSRLVESKHRTTVPGYLATSPVSDLRIAIGRTLIALGTRLAPDTRRAPKRASIGGLSPVGPADR